MAPLKDGDSFPDNVVFEWAPITDNDPTACGTIQKYNASNEFMGKKIVLVSVPGAFTPGCQVSHLTPFLQKIDEVRSKGIDKVIIIAYNDAWVMGSWGKANKVTDNEKILFMNDSSYFSEKHGWGGGKGDRNGRWAMLIDNGKVIYAANEAEASKVTVSGVDAVLAKL